MVWYLILILLYSLFSSFAFPVNSSLYVKYYITVSGNGNGNCKVLEYPQNFSGQITYCTNNEFEFPPYEHILTCTVYRFVSIDKRFEKYRGTNFTAYDRAMEELAMSLKGKNSIGTALNIAEWIRKNVKYDLGMGEAEKDAIWTFYNRRGTCDEIAHLFIALARAAGLNARYVGGFAKGKEWLPHAWAEVWTEFGWFPIDIPFEEYGIVDALHIITYIGNDGNHKFIEYFYRGNVDVESSERFNILSQVEWNLSAKIESSPTYSGKYALIKFTAYNPFDFPIAFPVRFSYPDNFKMEKVYGKSYALLYPGENTIFYVFKVQKIPEGTIYKIPFAIQIGDSIFSTNITVYGRKFECFIPEPVDNGFVLRNCINLDNGIEENFTHGGNYFCDACFYSLPTPINFTVESPNACFKPCNITIFLHGIGNAEIAVNGIKKRVRVKGVNAFIASVNSTPAIITVNKMRKVVNFTLFTPPRVSYRISNGRACFTSDWNITPECYDLRCGENNLVLTFSKGEYSLQHSFKVYRECGLIEKILEKIIYFLTPLIS